MDFSTNGVNIKENPGPLIILYSIGEGWFRTPALITEDDLESLISTPPPSPTPQPSPPALYIYSLNDADHELFHFLARLDPGYFRLFSSSSIGIRKEFVASVWHSNPLSFV